MIVGPVVSFQQMHRNRISKDVGGVALHIASIDDLVSLKTGTGRQKDASDIEALRMVQRMGDA